MDGAGTSDWLAGDIRLILVSSLKALPRNLSCRPLNEECVKAEIRSTKALFSCRCLCDTDSSARETLIKSQSQIPQEILYMTSS